MVSVLSVPSITLIFYLFKQRRMPIQNEHPFSFVFGGCESSAKWKGSDLWQPGEAPTEKELARAHESLAACENKVDYVLTHKNERGRERSRRGCGTCAASLTKRWSIGTFTQGTSISASMSMKSICRFTIGLFALTAVSARRKTDMLLENS